MKNICIKISFLLTILSSALIVTATSDLEFIFVVPSYNNAQWVNRNLDSLAFQRTSVPYSIICVDDCSTDSTGKLMDDYAVDHNLSEPFLKIIHNPKRMGALYNIYTTIHTHCKDNQIVVLVDGDDVIAHNLVLDRLAREYADPHLWMTYGSFIFYPSGIWGTTFEIMRELFRKEKYARLPM